MARAKRWRQCIRGDSAETNLDMALMVDIGTRYGYGKNKIRVGVGYQFWNNKFGNSRRITRGAEQRASTPMSGASTGAVLHLLIFCHLIFEHC